MNRPVSGMTSVWPKWVNAYCELCGDYVPRGHVHLCDGPKDAAVEAKIAALATVLRETEGR